MKILLTFSILLLSTHTEARLLDKISGVFNDQVYTVSQLRRIKSTLKQRKQVTPQLYDGINGSLESLQQLLFNIGIIREGLKEIGYQITDERVEETINERQKMLGLNRAQLVNSLRQFKINFNEYFELIRASLEYKVFFEVVILPLVNITNQEIKNEFIKINEGKKSVAITYQLKNYSIPLNNKTKSLNLIESIKKYNETKILPSELSGTQEVDIDDVSEESLIPKFRKALKGTPENGFSKPAIVQDRIHVFYVKKLEFKNSNFFNSQKNILKGKLIEKAAKDMKDVWLRREADKYFIKFYL